MRAFCLVGVRGSGKTALIRGILPKLPHVEYVSTDSVIRSLVGPHYTDFDHFPDEIKKQFRSRAIVYMKQETERSHRQLIVEDSMTAFNPNRRKIERAMPEEASYFYTDLILLSVDPRIVLLRRRADRQRQGSLDLEQIKREIAAEEEETRKFADHSHVDLHVIVDRGSPESAMHLLRILQGYA